MPRATALPILTLAASLALATVSAAHAQGRYGPEAPASAASDLAPAPNAAGAPASVPVHNRFLSWPGKAAAASAPIPALAHGVSATPAAAPAAAAAPAYKTLASYRSAPIRANSGWTPVPPPSTGARPGAVIHAPAPAPVLAGAPKAAAPTSIYDPARPAPVAAATPAPAADAPRAAVAAGQGNERVHFYSLHRQYGLQPDPAPIPPQFFAATADMSQPPGPIPTQRLTSGTGAATTTRTIRGADGSDASAGQQ